MKRKVAPKKDLAAATGHAVPATLAPASPGVSPAAPYDIDWHVCRANGDDVAESKKTGKPLKLGDELWRIPRRIGPVYPDHNHWTGDCLSGEEEDFFLMAASPVLLHTLKEVLSRCSMSNGMREEIEAAVKMATEGEGL